MNQINITPRQYAIEHNLPRYYTGEPCIHGHIAERYTKKTTCVECSRIKRQIKRKKVRAERKNLVKKTGKNKYFSGKPCSKGHIAERYVVNDRCIECHKLEKKRNYKKPTPETRQKQREYYAKRKGVTVLKKARIKAIKAAEHKAMLLTDDEKRISSYARNCLKTLYPFRHGGSFTTVNETIAELECGYTSEELIDYLSDAPNVRTRWGTYKNKNYWHVDHIIPLSKLIKQGVTEVWILNSLDNLRLIRATKNLEKSNKVSRKRLLTYIENHYKENPQRLGLYSPQERQKILNEEIVENTYLKLVSSLRGTEFSFNSSEIVVKGNIHFDLISGGVSVWTKRGKPTYREIREYIKEYVVYYAMGSGGSDFFKTIFMILSSYEPLRRVKRMRFNQFEYKTDCEKYYQQLIDNETDDICQEYLKRKAFENCQNCKEKGFFKSLFDS